MVSGDNRLVILVTPVLQADLSSVFEGLLLEGGLFDQSEDVHDKLLSALVPVVWRESNCVTVDTVTDA